MPSAEELTPIASDDWIVNLTPAAWLQPPAGSLDRVHPRRTHQGLRATDFSTGVAGSGYNVAAMSVSKKPLVGIIMGSKSDWETLQHAAAQLDELGVPYEAQVVSAHRTPDLLFEYASAAAGRGLEVIIAGAGGAAHLPGMAASKTALPVVGVPVESKALKGLDSLLSIVQMPGGVPVGTMAIGKAGAINAALLATAILGNKHDRFRKAYERFRKVQTQRVLEDRKLEKVAK